MFKIVSIHMWRFYNLKKKSAGRENCEGQVEGGLPGRGAVSAMGRFQALDSGGVQICHPAWCQ